MGREEWLAGRVRGIGGSEWSDVLNLEPYGCQRKLWYKKTGVPQDYPEEVSGAMKRGQKLERLVVEEFVELHNRTVWYPDDSVNAAEDFMEQFGRAETICGEPIPEWWIGTPDGAVQPLPGEAQPSILEVKTKGPWPYMKVVKEGVPEREILQGQHYLGLTGWQQGIYAYFEPCNWELMPLGFERDDTLLASMLHAGEKFWSMVKSGIDPERLDAGDKRCRSCPWLPTCQDVLSWDGTDEGGESDYEPCDNPEIERLVGERIEITAVKKKADEMLDNLNQTLISLTGGGAKYLTEHGKLKVAVGTYTRIDEKAFAAEYPRLQKRIKEKFTVSRPTKPTVNFYPKKKGA
jgi:hypothetical protein